MRNFKMVVGLLALGVASSCAQAATQGTVDFNGLLIAETCAIDPASENLVVTLPTLSVVTLAKDGATAGSKAFDINVINCDPAIKNVGAHFEAIGGSGSDSQTGNLINDAATDAATNVQVRLYNSDEKPMPLGTTGVSAPVKDGKATVRYYGGYYATGVTTAGKVHAKAQYTLSYN